MHRFSIGHKRLFISFLFIVASLFLGVNITLAHNPHHVIEALELSPAYEQDHTLFILVAVEGLLKSTDGGFSWKKLVNGLDNKTRLSAIAVSPSFETDQTLFVATEGDGIYRSQDGGASWAKVNTGLDDLRISSLAISADYAVDKIVLAVGTQGWLYRTENGGESWQQVLDTDDKVITTITFYKDKTELKAFRGDVEGVVYASMDGGATWQKRYQVADGGAITSIVVSPNFSSDGTIFLGTEKRGVLKSEDKGESYVEVTSGLADKSIKSLALSPEYELDGTLYVSAWYTAVFQSNDRGNSWQQYGDGLSISVQADESQYKSPHFREIRVAQTVGEDKTLFLAGYDGLFKSTDGGHSWVQMETLAARLVKDLDVSSGNGTDVSLALTTYGGGVYISDDQGLTWTINNQGLRRIEVGDIDYSPNYLSDNTLLMASDRYFYKSTNGGRSWNSFPLREANWRTRFSFFLSRWGLPGWLSEKFLSESDKQLMFADSMVVSPNFAIDNMIYFGTRYRGIFKSVDGGQNSSAIWDNQGISSLVISPDFSSDRTLFAGVRGEGVYKTVDGGETWQHANNGFTVTTANAWQSGAPLQDVKLVISPNYAADQTVFAGSIEGLFKTIDGGQNWQRLEGSAYGGMGLGTVAISPNYQDDQTVLVSVGGKGIFKSTDGGASFVEIGSDLIEHNYTLRQIKFSPAYATDHTLYGISDEEIFRSVDGGSSWEVMTRPIRYENVSKVIHYEGEWQLSGDDDFSASSVSYSDGPHQKAILNFVGTGVTWIGTSSNAQGIAKVYLDGHYEADVDQFSDSQQSMVTSYALTHLADGPHTIMIEVSDTKNPQSTGYRIDIDAFDIIPGGSTDYLGSQGF